MQQFQQLQQQQGRHLLQGPKTQQAITTIGELNQGACLAAWEHTRRGFSYSPPTQLTMPSRTRTTHGRKHLRIRYAAVFPARLRFRTLTPLASAGRHRVQRRRHREADRGHAVAAADAAIPAASEAAVGCLLRAQGRGRVALKVSDGVVFCTYTFKSKTRSTRPQAHRSKPGLAATAKPRAAVRLHAGWRAPPPAHRACFATAAAHKSAHVRANMLRRSTHIGTAVGQLQRRLVEHCVEALHRCCDLADACGLLCCCGGGDRGRCRRGAAGNELRSRRACHSLCDQAALVRAAPRICGKKASSVCESWSSRHVTHLRLLRASRCRRRRRQVQASGRHPRRQAVRRHRRGRVASRSHRGPARCHRAR